MAHTKGPDHKRQGSVMFQLRDRPNKDLRNNNKMKGSLMFGHVFRSFQFCWNILKAVCWVAKITRICTVTFIFCLLLLWTESFFFLSEANVEGGH